MIHALPLYGAVVKESRHRFESLMTASPALIDLASRVVEHALVQVREVLWRALRIALGKAQTLGRWIGTMLLLDDVVRLHRDAAVVFLCAVSSG